MKVTGDILRILDSGGHATLALLVLSAAFDTVDHDVLWADYGRLASVVHFIYLLGRTQYIRFADRRSNESPVKYGVPQGPGVY